MYWYLVGKCICMYCYRLLYQIKPQMCLLTGMPPQQDTELACAPPHPPPQKKIVICSQVLVNSFMSLALIFLELCMIQTFDKRQMVIWTDKGKSIGPP